MKITQEKSFKPVTIVIESQKELAVLIHMTSNPTFVIADLSNIAREFHDKLKNLS